MARIRTIKPEFWQDEKLSLLDPLTRLVFLGLVSMADDQGRLVDNLKLLDGQIFPNTDDTCRDALEILVRTSRVIRYRTANGQAVLQIANWDRHQKVAHPGKALLPGPDKAVLQDVVAGEALTPQSPAAFSPSSCNPRENLARTSCDAPADLMPRPSDLVTKLASDRVTKRPSDLLRTIASRRVPDTESGFAEFWTAYPKRAGGNPKRRAFGAWQARRREGIPVSDLVAGLTRYAAYLAHEGKIGTEYVLQAATFLGPDRRYEDPWDIAASVDAEQAAAEARGRAEREAAERDEVWLDARKAAMAAGVGA